MKLGLEFDGKREVDLRATELPFTREWEAGKTLGKVGPKASAPLPVRVRFEADRPVVVGDKPFTDDPHLSLMRGSDGLGRGSSRAATRSSSAAAAGSPPCRSRCSATEW